LPNHHGIKLCYYAAKLKKLEAEGKEVKPEVSVCICVRASDAFIGGCIRSLLNQTHDDFEIIVVEDPPFDNTAKIIASFHDRRLIYERNQSTFGISRSRNRCLRLSRGNYVFFTDADCVVSPDWIAKGLSSFALRRGIIGVEGRTYYVSKDYKPTYSDRSYVRNLSGGEFMTCNIAYKKKSILKIGGFDERYYGSEDRDLALRAMRTGEICFNPEMIVFHQKRTKNPQTYLYMGKRLGQDHPRVLLYKRFGEKGLSFWRFFNPLNLAIMLCPPLILVNLFFSSFKTRKDFALLPYAYVFAVFERLQFWATCARERVFLI
jgi:glycosyltransferase involved in cell wall biosynthesis